MEVRGGEDYDPDPLPPLLTARFPGPSPSYGPRSTSNASISRKGLPVRSKSGLHLVGDKEEMPVLSKISFIRSKYPSGASTSPPTPCTGSAINAATCPVVSSSMAERSSSAHEKLHPGSLLHNGQRRR